MTTTNDPYEVTFFTIDEAAKLLRVHRRTLDNLRWKKEGPRFRRHGGRIVYELKDLLAWSEQRRARFEPAQPKQKNAPSSRSPCLLSAFRRSPAQRQSFQASSGTSARASQSASIG